VNFSLNDLFFTDHFNNLVSCTVCITLWLYFLLIAGQNIRKLVKDGFIIKKPNKIHSRSRARRAHEAKQKGRHSGYGNFYTIKQPGISIYRNKSK
jgi:Ribosomal protein L19e